MTEPTKGERTRKKLVDATAALLRRQGYHATGLSDIVAESGAPRGSLYFYFPGGKDELACAALHASGEEWRARVDAAIAGARDLGGAIDAIVALLADDLEASGWDNGCPVAAVALEATSEPVRRAVAEHFTRWLDAITRRLTAAGTPAAIARQIATVALSAIEGALLLARVTRSREPLIAVGAALRAMTEGNRSIAGRGPPDTLARGNPRGMNDGDRSIARRPRPLARGNPRGMNDGDRSIARRPRPPAPGNPRGVTDSLTPRRAPEPSSPKRRPRRSARA